MHPLLETCFATKSKGTVGDVLDKRIAEQWLSFDFVDVLRLLLLQGVAKSEKGRGGCIHQWQSLSSANVILKEKANLTRMTI